MLLMVNRSDSARAPRRCVSLLIHAHQCASTTSEPPRISSSPPIRAARRRREASHLFRLLVSAYIRATDGARERPLQSFLSLIERGDLRKLSPDRGRFRAFLLAALQLLENQRVHDSAQKRGGKSPRFLRRRDRRTAFLADPTASGTPNLFDRTWALAILEATFGRIRLEWEPKAAPANSISSSPASSAICRRTATAAWPTARHGRGRRKDVRQRLKASATSPPRDRRNRRAQRNRRRTSLPGCFSVTVTFEQELV